MVRFRYMLFGAYRYMEMHSSRLLVGLMSAIFLYLAIRNTGVPTICPTDDIFYRDYTVLLPVSGSPRPNYLYYFIYSLVQFNGEHSFSIAKILNALFLVLAAPFIYNIAIMFCSKNASLLLVTASILGTVDAYTLTFMPETLYFFMFWVFSWYFITRTLHGEIRHFIVAGALFGLLSLVKPHALLLMPSLFLVIFFIEKSKGGKWLYNGILNNVIVFGSACAVKFIFGYLMAGTNGLTFLGKNYTSMAQTAGVMEILGKVVFNFPGHVQLISVLYGFPIAILISTALQRILGGSWKDKHSLFVFFTLFLSLNVVLTTTVFSGLAFFVGPNEHITRIHARYYNFIFPAFMIVGASGFGVYNYSTRRTTKLFIAALIMIAPIITIVTNMDVHIPSPIDCPEFYALKSSGSLRIFAFVTIILLAIWLFKDVVSTRIYLWLFIPAVTFIMVLIFYTACSNWVLFERTDPRMRAIQIIKNTLPPDESSQLLVVSPIERHGYALTALLDFNVTQDKVVYLPVESALDTSTVTAKWFLFCDDYNLNKEFDWVMTLPGDFSLAHKAETGNTLFNYSFDRNKITPSRIQIYSQSLNIKTIEGLSHNEAWGAWSNGHTVRFEFSVPLPKRFILHLTAGAFGPNINKPTFIKVGPSQREVKLQGNPTTSVIEFDNPSSASVIEFVVPEPVSPKSLGVNDDERLLGIGFINMKLVNVP